MREVEFKEIPGEQGFAKLVRLKSDLAWIYLKISGEDIPKKCVGSDKSFPVSLGIKLTGSGSLILIEPSVQIPLGYFNNVQIGTPHMHFDWRQF